MSRDITENRRGMYEYVLTKSVIFIFILGLVFLFYNFYGTLNLKSGSAVAVAEAQRIAKIIDDSIGFTGIETENKILLNNNLKVGREVVPYDLEIDAKRVIVRLIHPDYRDIVGVGTFGQGKLNIIGGSTEEGRIECKWSQIVMGGQIVVSKDDRFYYEPGAAGGGQMWYEINVQIDASVDCGEYLELQAAYEYGEST